MQKWEYCAVTDISGQSSGGFGVCGAHFVTFTLDGLHATTGRPPDTQLVVQRIAELGMDGWEMVGCGNVGEYTHTLYFKRPKA